MEPSQYATTRTARRGDTVVVSYVARRQNGTVFAESGDDAPLQLTLGEGQVLPALEQAIEGMLPGGVKTVRLEPEAAYGPHRPELVHRVPLARLPEDLDPDVGERVELHQPPDTIRRATVTARTESEIVFDANHHLAGQAISYELRLVAIRRAS
jgi:FKBP-type peptidyl-prolyl cis-trans isomerase 2